MKKSVKLFFLFNLFAYFCTQKLIDSGVRFCSQVYSIAIQNYGGST